MDSVSTLISLASLDFLLKIHEDYIVYTCIHTEIPTNGLMDRYSPLPRRPHDEDARPERDGEMEEETREEQEGPGEGFAGYTRGRGVSGAGAEVLMLRIRSMMRLGIRDLGGGRRDG
jgi:hypothetical protein